MNIHISLYLEYSHFTLAINLSQLPQFVSFTNRFSIMANVPLSSTLDEYTKLYSFKHHYIIVHDLPNIPEAINLYLEVFGNIDVTTLENYSKLKLPGDVVCHVVVSTRPK